MTELENKMEWCNNNVEFEGFNTDDGYLSCNC